MRWLIKQLGRWCGFAYGTEWVVDRQHPDGVFHVATNGLPNEEEAYRVMARSQKRLPGRVFRVREVVTLDRVVSPCGCDGGFGEVREWTITMLKTQEGQ